jgi:aminopeptidase N
MKFTKKKLLWFSVVLVASVALLLTAIFTMAADNILLRAEANADTITISAEYDDNTHTLNALQSVTYKNDSDKILSEVKFYIYANAYRQGAKFPPVSIGEVTDAYPTGAKTYGSIEITGADADKRATAFRLEGEDDTVLTVPLFNTLAPQATATIEIEYVVTLANIKHRLGYTERAVNLSHFYPVPVKYTDSWKIYPYSYNGDPFYNDIHNFDVTLTVPKDFSVASSGVLIRESTSGNKKTVHYKSSAIRDYAAVMSKQFSVLTAFQGKINVSYYFLDDPNAADALRTACDAIKTFSAAFMKYPYKQLTVVQTDFLHGGMEYGELVYISSNITDTIERDYVIAHEIAHQWWYGIVGNNQSATAWIDEGLAEYSTLVFYDKNPNYNRRSADIIKSAYINYATYLRMAHDVGASVDKHMNRDLTAFSNPYEYVYMTYTRGMLLFTNLQSLFGQVKVLRGLQNLANTAKFAFADSVSLIAALEKSTGAKLQVFFDSYLGGL